MAGGDAQVGVASSSAEEEGGRPVARGVVVTAAGRRVLEVGQVTGGSGRGERNAAAAATGAARRGRSLRPGPAKARLQLAEVRPVRVGRRRAAI